MPYTPPPLQWSVLMSRCPVCGAPLMAVGSAPRFRKEMACGSSFEWDGYNCLTLAILPNGCLRQVNLRPAREWGEDEGR